MLCVEIFDNIAPMTPTTFSAPVRSNRIAEAFNNSTRSLDDSFLLRPTTCTIRVTDENGRVIHDSPPIRRMVSPNGPRGPNDRGLSIPDREDTLTAVKSATPAAMRQRDEVKARQPKQDRPVMKAKPPPAQRSPAKPPASTRTRDTKDNRNNRENRGAAARDPRDNSRTRSTSRKAVAGRRVP